MKFFKFAAIGCLLMFFLGLLAGSVCAFDDAPPAVSVDVDASAQVAIEEEAPVLPDDFARNDPPRISAQWLPVEQPEQLPEPPSSPAVESDSGITLFTADGTWRCRPCENQQSTLVAFPPSFKFKTIKIPKEGQSPTGTAPVWQGADGALHEGPMDRNTLETWAKAHGKKDPPAEKIEKASAAMNGLKPVSVVEVESGKSAAVLAALVQHLSRSGVKDGGNVAQSWLPEIDVDLSDPLLFVLDSMLSKDGYKLGGLKVSWPAGKRAIVFDPPIDVAYRKVLEVSSKVKSVEINGREVVIRLDGRLVNDLKVRLK